MAFRNEGDVVVLLGSDEVRGEPRRPCRERVPRGSSTTRSPAVPTIDIDLEAAVQRVCRKCRRCWHTSTPPTTAPTEVWPSPSPRAVSPENIGFIGSFDWSGRWDAAFFGETESRIVVSLPEDRLTQLVRPMLRRGCTHRRAGKGRVEA